MAPFVYRAATLLLAVLLVVSVSHWVLTFSARRTPAEPVRVLPAGELDAQARSADITPVARLMGSAAAGDIGNIRALGVMAEGGTGKGIAVLGVEGKPARSYRTGDVVVPGVVLHEVRKDGVVLSRAGALQEVRLPTRSAPAASPPPISR
jgi:general secretion pathway protein C